MIFSKNVYVACSINHAGKLICLGACLYKRNCAGLIDKPEVPADWSDIITVSLFKRKGDASGQSNYRRLESTNHVLKVIERVIKNMICGIVHIDEMQFCSCPGQYTTDAIFILRQLQEMYLTKHRKLYMAFVDLE